MRHLVALMVFAAAPPSWHAPMGEYLDAYRAFYSGDNSWEALTRLTSLAEEARQAVPSTAELRSALLGDDPRRAALAVTGVAVSKPPARELLDLLLPRFAREPDWIIRQLILYGIAGAGRDWLEDRGAEIAAAVASEKDPAVATIAATNVLPRLPRGDALVAAASLASNGGPEARQVLYASRFLSGGAAALRDLADELRRRGRPDRAAEAEANARAQSCNRARAETIGRWNASHAEGPVEERAHVIAGPHDWHAFRASHPAVAETLDASVVKSLTRRDFFAVAFVGTVSKNGGALWILIDASTCQVLHSGWDR